MLLSKSSGTSGSVKSCWWS